MVAVDRAECPVLAQSDGDDPATAQENLPLQADIGISKPLRRSGPGKWRKCSGLRINQPFHDVLGHADDFAALVGRRQGRAATPAFRLDLLDLVSHRDGISDHYRRHKANPVITDGHECQVVPSLSLPLPPGSAWRPNADRCP